MTHANVTHIFVYFRVKTESKEGFIRHYRNSKKGYIEKLGPLRNDIWVAEWSKRIENNVKAVRNHIFGTKPSG